MNSLYPSEDSNSLQKNAKALGNFRGMSRHGTATEAMVSLQALAGQDFFASKFELSWEDFDLLCKHLQKLLRHNGYRAQLRKDVPDRSHKYSPWSKKILNAWFTLAGQLKSEAKFSLKYYTMSKEMSFEIGWACPENERFLEIEEQQLGFWKQFLNDLNLVLLSPDPPIPPGMELSSLKEIYRRIDSRTSYLSFSADFTDSDITFPETVIPTYGEMTFGGMQRVMLCLQELGLGKDSRFLDIGSGYGKPCFHISLEAGANCEGVEFCPSRVQIANEMLERIAQERAEIRGQVSFLAGNVFDLKEKAYDFLYWYNPLRGAQVNRILSQFQTLLLSGRIQWRFLAIYQPPACFPKLRLVKKLPKVRTTGSQSFTLYVYEC